MVIVSSLRVARPLPVLIVPIFALGLATTELSCFFLLLQLATGLVFVGLGAAAGTGGKLALLLLISSCLGLWRMHRQSHKTGTVLKQELHAELGSEYQQSIPASRQVLMRDGVYPQEWLRPFCMRRPGVEKIEDVSYGDAGERNLLDLYVPSSARKEGFPVLLQIHGGAWYSGHKQQQTQPLLYHMGQRGWVCVSINYRLSPQDRFPAHIVDVKKAIGWIRSNIDTYGGNPEFLAVTGGSAGGHLVARAGLSINDRQFQPGFEEANTQVDAVVPIYGVYDFCDVDGKDLNLAIRNFLGDQVMPGSIDQCQALWQGASPICRTEEGAPPFFVIHGNSDVMTSWELAGDFSSRLRKTSSEVVAYAELPGAQHGFDGMHSVRPGYLENHIASFLEWSYAQKLQLSI
mgnify:CR=1 FL=1